MIVFIIIATICMCLNIYMLYIVSSNINISKQIKKVKSKVLRKKAKILKSKVSQKKWEESIWKN